MIVNKIKMLRLSFSQTYKILNGQNILRCRSSAASIYSLSKSFQIVQATQELDSRETNVVDSLYNGLLSSNRACLAQSITLTESTHPRKRLQARSLLKKALQHCKQCQQKENSYSFRIGTKLSFIIWSAKDNCILRLLLNLIGLSGPPGAGKSTFLENMGKFLTTRGEKIAVLAVDPSSTTNGGTFQNALCIILQNILTCRILSRIIDG